MIVCLLAALLFLMPTYIVRPSDADHCYFGTYSNDFAYSFSRGSTRWMCLYAYPIWTDVTNPKRPAIFKSTDSGASWSEMGAAGAPVVLEFNWPAIAYDSRYDPAQASITLLYADNYPTYTPSGHLTTDRTDTYHLIDFDFASGSYGGLYSGVAVTNVEQTPLFSKFPNGDAIMVYNRTNYPSGDFLGTFYQIYSGGWGGEQLLRSGNYPVHNLAVDSSDVAHVLFSDSYYRIGGGSSALPVTSTGNGNLSVVGNSLIVPVYAGGLKLLTGSPLSAPVWSQESITAGSIRGIQGTMWFSQLSGSYALVAEIVGADDATYTTDSSASGYTLHWAGAGVIQRSVKSGGTWGAATNAWSGSASAIFQVAARGAAGGGKASRYRGY